MSHLGEIVDLGLNYDSEIGWFMGTGYVVLQQNPEKTYAPLFHKLLWGNAEEFFHATFPDMPTWCRYCHEDGHTKYDCSKSRASILCFACDQFGHRQTECPNPRSSKSTKARTLKKPRKTPANEQVQDASSELMKSKYASTPAPSTSTSSISQQDFTIANTNFLHDKEDGDYVPPADSEAEYSGDEEMEDTTNSNNILDESRAEDFNIMQIDNIYVSDRFLLCQISHPHGFYAPYFILNVYAPATSNVQRREFFDSICSMFYQLYASDTISLHRLIISGDFNYDYNRDIIRNNYAFKTSTEWVSFLLNSFYDCMAFHELDPVPIFQRNLSIQSVIDYIYAGYDIQHMITGSNIEHLKPQWSDHALLSVKFTLGESQIGPGLWRGNPVYATNKFFQKILQQKLESLIISMSPDLSTQMR
ncbi:hypothetical protein HPULCUR_005400 [Helicostylum pulchrum]|uniref:CCHC-type domain-containing protein n=1 Tax=Helicostylum pulchrum TaxID=562976 RepID=A0ABP9XYY2_9FUNG